MPFMRTRLLLTSLMTVAAVSLTAQAPDRSRPPALGPAPSLNLPRIEKQQLSNGVPVWIVELHEVPVVQVNLVVLSGSGDDPAGKYGIASLTAAMMMEGAGTRSSLELADAIDFLGADLDTGSTSDASAVRLHTPVSRLADALPIMADVALRPTFPAQDLDRIRQERLTTLLQARDDPSTIAALAFSRVLYGTANRYGTASMGTGVTLRGFTPDDLRQFYQTAFRPDNATLLVVGDVTPAMVAPLLERQFGSWKAGSTSAPAHIRQPAPPQRTRREVYLLDKPGAPQSQIRIGAVGAARSTPDYFPITVLNNVLGGAAFSSRLNLNLREKHGYTYGASSTFDMRLDAGPFAAFAGVQTDKTAAALSEFFNELNAIQQPVPPDELARAKSFVSLRYPGGFETTGDISRRLEEAIVYHLPDDSFSRYVPNIEAVTGTELQRVARRYIHPDQLAVVVVGDQKAIQAPIEALKLGPVTVLSIDDLFGLPAGGR
jgi:predicted Zn-dependent peptidase